MQQFYVTLSRSAPVFASKTWRTRLADRQGMDFVQDHPKSFACLTGITNAVQIVIAATDPDAKAKRVTLVQGSVQVKDHRDRKLHVV